MLELFNPEGAFGAQPVLKFISSKVGEDFLSVSDQDLLKFIKEKPVYFIDLISEFCDLSGFASFSFKVFPGQINEEKFSKFFLRSDKVKKIFIVRERLNVYASFKKAMNDYVWHNQDTTTKQVSFDFEEFKEWAKDLDEWYEGCLSEIVEVNQNPVIVRYESDIDLNLDSLVQKQYLIFKSLGLNTSFVNSHESSFTKQDKANSSWSKFSNEEVCRELLQKDLRYIESPFLF